MTDFNSQTNPNWPNDDWAQTPPIQPVYGVMPGAWDTPASIASQQGLPFGVPDAIRAPGFVPLPDGYRRNGHEGVDHSRRNKIIIISALGGLLASGAGLGGAAYLNRDDNADYLNQTFAETRLAQTESDPKDRASEVTALKDGQKVGSASLIRRADGQIAVVTVEHVARPLSGMESTIVEAHRGGSVAAEPLKAGDVRFNVPSFGLIKDETEPVFIGEDLTANGSANDRVAFYGISADEQQSLLVAEATGSLKIPEASTYQPTFGEVLTMPTANLTSGVKFVYLGKQADAHQLEPLAILDEGMDVTKGLANLAQQVAVERAKSEAGAVADATEYLQNGGYSTEGKTNQQILHDALTKVHFAAAVPSDEFFQTSAIFTLEQQFADRYDDRLKDPGFNGQKIADTLPCHGDSGGVLVDPDGGVMGVLSAGETLTRSADNWPINLMRQGQHQTCLGTASFRIVTGNM